MLQEEQNKPNSKAQRKSLFKREICMPGTPKFDTWKRAVLLALGLVGLNVIAEIIAFMTLGLPKEQQIAIINLVTYGVLFSAMLGVVFKDVPKIKFWIKDWRPYVFGLFLGAFVVMFDIFYVQFINLFYPLGTGGNETSVRSVIDIYPVASVFIIGLIGPLCEELAYRVGLFGLLRKVNLVLAYAITGIVFGFLHFDYMSGDIAQEFILLPCYIVPGMVFSLGYQLYGLPCSFVAHATNNLYAVIMQIISKYI